MCCFSVLFGVIQQISAEHLSCARGSKASDVNKMALGPPAPSDPCEPLLPALLSRQVSEDSCKGVCSRGPPGLQAPL